MTDTSEIGTEITHSIKPEFLNQLIDYPTGESLWFM
jgi:hypothetical protein